MDECEKKKQYKYIPKIDFYPKLPIQSIKIKNTTIYMYSTLDEILIIQLFALNGQQKITKKFQIVFREIYFMNQNNDFAIIDCGSISIWKLDHKYNYAEFDTILNDEQELVASLVIAKNDDLIVNSMWNGTLLFWRKNIDWKCYLRLQDDWGCLYNLSLNQKGDKLIAINNQAIFLFSCDLSEKQNEWTLKEKINKKYQTLCFIDDANLACISSDQNVITIYEIPAKLKQYQNVSLQGKTQSNYSLIEYKTQKQLLLAQKDNRVYLIQRNGQGKYVLQQKILFPNEELLVSFSNNGNFLLLNSTFDELNDSCRKIELRILVAID